MKKIVIILMAVLFCPYLYAQTLTAEYFFDIDPGFGKGTSVAVVENQTITLNLESLNAGLHTMYIRVKDQNGLWSLTNASSFIVFGQFTSPTITKVEYFFDIDPGFGKGTAVDLAETLVLNLESLSDGLHTAYIRVQDQNGSWSLSNSATFILLGQFTNPNIVKAEYYFDTDPGFGMATSLSVSASSNLDEQYLLDVSALSVGDHLLIIRTQDENGSWSITNNDTFTICTPPANPTFEMDTVLVCTVAGLADKVTLTTNSTVSTPVYRWYDTALANKTLLEQNSTGIYDALNIDRDSTFYVSVLENACESGLTPITINIEIIPEAPSAEVETILLCTMAGVADNTTLTAISNLTNPIFRWYDTDLDNRTILAENSTGNYDALNVNSDSTFYVAVFVGSCESDLVSIKIDIEINPSAPTLENETMIVCTDTGVNDKVTLSASSTVASPLFRWYNTDLADKALLEENSTGIYDALNIDRDSTFYVAVVEGSCESELTAITIDIETNPTAPVISLIGNDKQLSSDVSGQLQWYLEGVAISNATDQTYQPSESGMYQVSITSTKGCESISAVFDFSFITTINKGSVN